jgi:uncharacterized protein (DUF2141 family)
MNLAQLSCNLTVAIIGLRSSQGQLCLSLFSGEEGFPSNSDCAMRNCCIRATNTPLFAKFVNLTSGNYSVTVFHDANNNGTLDRNWLGIPTEGFGFSQNPKIFMGLPRFKDTSVVITNQDIKIEIQLNYLSFNLW